MTQELSITPDSIEIWLTSPVTKAYLASIEDYLDQLSGTKILYDCTSADRTLSMNAERAGAIQSVSQAANYINLMTIFGYLEASDD